jgi:hypothetical protein
MQALGGELTEASARLTATRFFPCPKDRLTHFAFDHTAMRIPSGQPTVLTVPKRTDRIMSCPALTTSRRRSEMNAQSDAASEDAVLDRVRIVVI